MCDVGQPEGTVCITPEQAKQGVAAAKAAEVKAKTGVSDAKSRLKKASKAEKTGAKDAVRLISQGSGLQSFPILRISGCLLLIPAWPSKLTIPFPSSMMRR